MATLCAPSGATSSPAAPSSCSSTCGHGSERQRTTTSSSPPTRCWSRRSARVPPLLPRDPFAVPWPRSRHRQRTVSKRRRWGTARPRGLHRPVGPGSTLGVVLGAASRGVLLPRAAARPPPGSRCSASGRARRGCCRTTRGGRRRSCPKFWTRPSSSTAPPRRRRSSPGASRGRCRGSAGSGAWTPRWWGSSARTSKRLTCRTPRSTRWTSSWRCRCTSSAGRRHRHSRP
mmetsp:Transcript_3291/g.10241  ORF Transcript_3291/g.10241 Transcript_3291/m.10241 type:complete len:230 (+) Transcript_3291:1078-1767(+)